MKKLTNAEMERAIAIRTAKKLNMRIKKVGFNEQPTINDAIYLLEWFLGSALTAKNILTNQLPYPTNNDYYEGYVKLQAAIFRSAYKKAYSLKDDDFNSCDYRVSLCKLLDTFIEQMDLSNFVSELSNHTDLQKFLDYSILYFREEM